MSEAHWGKGLENTKAFLNEESWPLPLRANAPLLSDAERELVSLLLAENQQHLFSLWDPPGINDDLKHNFFHQIQRLHNSYNGGLCNYLTQAKRLLNSARLGENPMEGWIPEVPDGVHLDNPTSETFLEYERIGIQELDCCGFVLVAGGLGERLGYSGIKVELPVETTTGTSYLDLYCKQILAFQSLCDEKKSKNVTTDTHKSTCIPFAIMVSEDTEMGTRKLLETNNYFGLKERQVIILKQEKVAALSDNDAYIAVLGPYDIDAKPHGHGDIHSLMHSTGTAKKWLDEGIRWCIFFQDTNGLAFYTLAAMLGVSKTLNLEVNTLAVPRKAKQAAGAITKLVNSTDARKCMTINVEYNQLDPLLRATISPQGDVNDPKTGLSPFPGNTNQLVFQMSPYVATLQKTCGIIAEFVNPKYSDDTKTKFKKPTRLECMMQDYPKVLSSEAKVGFTLAPAWLCYSPCKNNGQDAMQSARMGIPPSCAFSSETDQYYAQAELLRRLGVIAPPADKISFPPYDDIYCVPGPRIVINPSCAVFASTLKLRFPFPQRVQITARSSLVIVGDVIVKSLCLDGALRLVAVPGTRMIVDCKTPITNAGTEYQQIHNNQHRQDDNQSQGHSLSSTPTPSQLSMCGIAADSEISRMRGYILVRHAEESVTTVFPNDKGEVTQETRDSNTAISIEDDNKDSRILEFIYLGGDQLIPRKAVGIDDDRDESL